jgi:hypothetical protein
MEEIQEIGEEGYRHLKDTLRFGDIIENGYASEDNPRRLAIIVKARGHSINCTDGKGDYWDLLFDPKARIKLHGTALNPQLFTRIG